MYCFLGKDINAYSKIAKYELHPPLLPLPKRDIITRIILFNSVLSESSLSELSDEISRSSVISLITFFFLSVYLKKILDYSFGPF